MSTAPSRSFGSVGVAMVTPLMPSGEVDYDAARALVVSLVDDGADLIFLSGITGESPTIHTPERQELIRQVKDALSGRAMAMAGAGSNGTVHAVRIGVASQEAGAEGLLINTPYYNRPSQEGAYRHINAVVEATDLPVIVHDVPGRAGVKITEETLARLAENPRVKAAKDAIGDVEQGFRRMESTGLEYYSGDDGLSFAWFAHGASGVISVAAHVDAHSWRQMIDAVDAGDLTSTHALARNPRPLVHAIMGDGQRAVMAKEALYLQGRLPSPALCLPLVRAEEAKVATLREVLTASGLL